MTRVQRGLLRTNCCFIMGQQAWLLYEAAACCNNKCKNNNIQPTLQDAFKRHNTLGRVWCVVATSGRHQRDATGLVEKGVH